MKKVIILIILCLVGICSYSQKTKTVEVFKNKSLGILKVLFVQVNGTSMNDTLVSLSAQNSNYTITNIITMYGGNYKKFCSFLDKIIEFRETDEDGTSDTIDEHRVELYSVMGIKGVWIYEKNGTGRHSYTIKGLKKIKAQFLEWCKKNNINI